jgi:hypothetical protein
VPYRIFRTGTLSCSEGKGHTFESCRVRQLGKELGTPKPAVFALDRRREYAGAGFVQSICWLFGDGRRPKPFEAIIWGRRDCAGHLQFGRNDRRMLVPTARKNVWYCGYSASFKDSCVLNSRIVTAVISPAIVRRVMPETWAKMLSSDPRKG